MQSHLAISVLCIKIIILDFAPNALGCYTPSSSHVYIEPWIFTFRRVMEGNSINSVDKSAESQDSYPVSRVQSTGDYILLGGKKYHKQELYSAFAGTFQTERYAVPPENKFGNAPAYGLAGFSVTTLMLAILLTGSTGTSIVVGCMIFSSGLSLFLAGLWEFFVGNTFAYTAFTSFGAFWISFGAINIPAFGVAAAYGDDTDQFMDSIGFFLLGWVVFITIMTTFTFKATLAFLVTFVALDTTFLLLAIFYLTRSHNVQLAGAAFAIFTSIMAYYNMFAGTATPTNCYFKFKVFPLPVWESKK